ncbi:MAG: protein kinase [Planctomycetaceae bacterium]|nr:protein kinase [Planctomycetaceae bacterium]
MSGIGCPTREELASFALGEIAEADADAILRHLEQCERCEASLSEVESSTDRIVDLCRQPAPLDRYSQEAGCQEAITRAIALGGGFADATAATPAETVSTSEEEEEPILGQMGDYRLVEELSHGGMGTVYRAVHTRLGREVALKVLPKGRNTDQRAVARFEREMAAVGKLDHPNIVRATDAGEVEGVQYLAMELIDGFDLTELVDLLGPLGVANSCEIIRQAAMGLQCAYEKGLVHRDIKPSNVMVTASGIAKVLDLGLARFHIDKQSNVELTTAGQPMGTADYMAPEQVADTHSVDIRADLYSLGCTFYKILAGQPPFGGVQYSSSFDKMMAHRKETPPAIQEFRPDLPKKVVAVLEQMLAKDPDERFQRPSDLAESLYPLCAGANLPEMIEKAWQAAETAPMPQPTAEATSGDGEERGSSATAPRRKRRGPGLGSAGGSSTHSASRSQYSNFYVMPPPPKPQWGLWIAIFVLSGLLIAIVSAYTAAWWFSRGQSTGPNLAVTGRLDWDVPLDREVAKVPDAVALRLPPGRPPIVRGALGEEALVTKPAEIEGLTTWTLETVGPRTPVLCASVAPGGKALATGSGEGAIRIWDLGNGSLRSILIYPGRDGAVRALAWAPGGSYLAAAYQSGILMIWDVDNGTVLPDDLSTRSLAAGSLAWSPDGTVLAYVDKSPDQDAHDVVMLWDFKANKPLASLEGARDRLRAVAFAPDGSKVAAGGGDRSISIWEVTGRTVSTIPTNDMVSALAWSPCASMIASSSEVGNSGIALWNVETGEKLGDLPQHPGRDQSLVWLASAPTIVATGTNSDGKTRYYDLTRGTLEKEVDTGDGLLIRTGPADKPVFLGQNGSVRFCESADLGGVVAELPVSPSVPSALASSPDGKTIACGSEDGLIRLVATESGEVLGRFNKNGAVKRLVYSPDASMLAVTTEGWSRSQRREPATTVLDARSGDELWQFRLGGKERIDDLAWSPDGALIATVGDELRLWNGKTGQFDRQHPYEAECVVWVSGGSALAVGSPKSVALLDAAGLNDIWSFPESSESPRRMAWSEQKGLLAVTGGNQEERQIVVLTAESNEPKQRLRAGNHTRPITALGWATDGKSLLSGSPAETCVWDVEKGTGSWLRTIGSHLFTPDGALSVATGPSIVRMQETQGGSAVRTVLWLPDGKYAIISPDGNYTGSTQLGEYLTYVVQKDDGQETLNARKFADQYRWRNDAEKAKAPTE